MAFKAGSGYVDFDADDKKLLTAADRIKMKLSKLSGFMKGIAGHARNMFLAGAGASAYAIKKAGDAQEVISKFEAVFKEQSEAADDFAETLADSIKRNKIEVMSFMSTFQDTFVPLGFAREEGRKLAEQLAELTYDLASFNNVADPEVLRDLQSALVGNHETMRKYGVIIQEATLNEYMIQKGWVKSAKEATNQQKVLARLNLILEGTTDAQGDALRTSDSFNNRIKGLTSQVTTFAISIGGTLIPLLETWMDKLDTLSNYLNSLSDEDLANVRDGIVKTGKVLIAIWLAPKLIGGIAAFIKLLTGVRRTLIALSATAGFTGTAMATAITGVVGIALVATLSLLASLGEEMARIKMQAMELQAQTKDYSKASRSYNEVKQQVEDLKAAGATDEEVGAAEAVLLQRTRILRKKDHEEAMKYAEKELEAGEKKRLWQSRTSGTVAVGAGMPGILGAVLSIGGAGLEAATGKTEHWTAQYAQAKSLREQSQMAEARHLREIEELEASQSLKTFEVNSAAKAELAKKHAKEAAEAEKKRKAELYRKDIEMYLANDREKKILTADRNRDELLKTAELETEKAAIRKKHAEIVAGIEKDAKGDEGSSALVGLREMWNTIATASTGAEEKRDAIQKAQLKKQTGIETQTKRQADAAEEMNRQIENLNTGLT